MSHIITTMNDICEARKAREQRAAVRALRLFPNSIEYYASGNNVCYRDKMGERIAVRCESHWDACLVLLALPS